MQRLRAFLRRRRRPDSDFAEEIETHIAIEAERLIAEGLSAEQAHHEARRRFGNIGAANERYHESRSVVFMDAIIQDLRYGWRALRRSPVFTAVAVLSLALGVGANTAVFTFVNAVLFKPLAVKDPKSLVWVQVDERFATMDYPSVVAFRKHPGFFDGVAGTYPIDRSNVAIDHSAVDPGTVRVHLVTGDYFSLFGVSATRGRVITMEDERAPGAHPVVVISDAYWRSHFQRTPDVIGHTLTLNQTTFTVIGVAPASFTGDELGTPAELWIPIMMQAEVMTERSSILMNRGSWVRMFARLKPGISAAQAADVATSFYRTVAPVRFASDPQWKPELAATITVQLHDGSRGYSASREDAAAPMLVVWVIVALVLAIACVNVAALLLVRATTRERELTTRLALGASTRRVARLLLTEGAIIGAVASVVGTAMAFAGVRWLERVAASGITVYRLPVSPDVRIIGLTAAVSIMTMLVCGLVPAYRASRLAVVSGLKGAMGSGTRAATSRGRLGKILVVAQVALALVLVIGAGLFTRTLSKLESQDMGFDQDRLLEAFTAPNQVNLSGVRLADLFDVVSTRVGALPDVNSVTVSTRGLLPHGGGSMRTNVPGYVLKPGEWEFVPFNYVTPGFFSTSGIDLIAGRDFTTDDIAGHPQVAIISESMARHYFGTADAIGKRYGIGPDENASIEVIGVARDAKDVSLRDENVSMMYLPYRQAEARLSGMRVIVRSNGNPAALVSAVRHILSELSPSLPVAAIEPIEAQMRRSVAMERFTALASVFFGTVALMLAALGMFAMVSHAVTVRTPEIGIRMALGGSRSGVVRMVLRENLVLVSIGLIVGGALAMAATRVTASRLFGVSPTDIGVIASAVVVMAVATFVAIIIPARRATRVDPAITLRHD